MLLDKKSVGSVDDFVIKLVCKGTAGVRDVFQMFRTQMVFEEFGKLSTKSCMTHTMNNLKESFTIMKAITTRTTLKIYDDCMLRYTYVRYVV